MTIVDLFKTLASLRDELGKHLHEIVEWREVGDALRRLETSGKYPNLAADIIAEREAIRAERLAANGPRIGNDLPAVAGEIASPPSAVDG